MQAIRVHAPGGPEALRLEEVAVPLPGEGEVRVRLEAIGVNFIDVYHRSGLYRLPAPFTPGSEGAGRVDAVGAGVTEVRTGERVGFAMGRGAYAEQCVVKASLLVRLPDEIDTRTAAAALLQGMTAHYLTHSTFPLERGQWAMVHAAAGGVGLLLVQVAKLRGARVLATVSTAEKASLARAAGADEVVIYTEQEFAAEALRVSGGRGVDVVYDSVGASTFEASLRSLARRGMLVLFGQSSGAVGPVDPMLLAAGSLYLTRPALADYIHQRGELEARARDLFAWLGRGEIKLRIDRVLALAEAAEAHALLESRATTGKLLLLP